MLLRFSLLSLSILFCNVFVAFGQTQETYAEKLGWKKGDRVLILHVDDAGMSHDSNEGTIQAIEKGVSTSVSIMMPCGWVPEFATYLQTHKNVDAGLHLVLTSEWKGYRWGPVTGLQHKGLLDQQGALWPDVPSVVQHASPAEVEAEVRAQIDKAKTMGITPTHLDSHMGTLFTPSFLPVYVKMGMEYKIPILMPGGHATLVAQSEKLDEATKQTLQNIGKQLWSAGLPVIDDMFANTYGWNLAANGKPTDEELRKFKTDKYIELLKSAKPGITEVIMHCTATSENFPFISDSGNTRKGDLLAMLDPRLKEFLKKEGFILTTWRELQQRRQNAR